MPKVELNTDYQTAQRFPAWIVLTVFSAVCLAGVESQYPSQPTAGHKWSLAVTIISLVLSFVSVAFYLLARHLFIATPLEIGTAALLLIFWAAGFSVMMNPSRGIAVDASAVINANLYFGCWACLIAIVFIAGSLAQDITGVHARDVAPVKIARWYALSATSIIVWASSVRFFVARQCHNPYLTHTQRCKRTKFAIAMGVVSCVVSMGMAYIVRYGMGLMVEFGVTAFLFIMWCFGVGLITFGQSPGALIGNLYFSTWISFLLIIMIFAQAFQDFTTQYDTSDTTSDENGGEAATSNGDQMSPEGDIKVEAEDM